MKAPKPLNFRAMSNAWNDPVAFARELNAYYAQLAEAGAQQTQADWMHQQDTNEEHDDKGTR